MLEASSAPIMLEQSQLRKQSVLCVCAQVHVPPTGPPYFFTSNLALTDQYFSLQISIEHHNEFSNLNIALINM